MKAAALSVVGAVLSLMLRKNTPETALLLTLSVSCVVLYFGLQLLEEITGFFERITAVSGLSGAVISIVLKCAGISVITKFAVGICDEAGQKSVSTGVELVGAASALYTALPLMETVLERITGLL